MSGIQVPVISQIVLLAIKKGVADMSPLVRKAAALAIPKCARLDPNTMTQLEDFLSTLLGDKQYFVAAAAVQAFMEVFGWDRIDLIHKHYRGLVKKMVDMDDWGQIATLKLLTGYARRCFPQRWKRVRRRGEIVDTEKDFYADDIEPVQVTDESVYGEEAESTSELVIDPDLELLLKSAQLLLHSRNSAVTISITRLYLALAPTSHYLATCVGPLIALLRAPPSIAETALFNTLQIALHIPTHFRRYTTHFLLRTTDTSRTQELKLEMLTLLFPHSNMRGQSLILTELSHFSSSSPSSPDGQKLVRHCVRAIGRCAQSAPPGSRTADRCMGLLLSFLSSPSSASGGVSNQLVAESLTVLRHLIQADPSSHVSTVTRLAKNLDDMRDPSARAAVVWLVGEYAGLNGGENISADVLRILAKGFVGEEEAVRAQICLLAAKVYCVWLNSWHAANGQNGKATGDAYQSLDGDASIDPSESRSDQSYVLPAEENGWSRDTDATTETDQPPITGPPQDHPIPILFTYILSLARYDTSYDLRDRCRVYKSLLAVPSSTQLATLLLLAPKPVPLAPSPSEARKDFMLGSAALVLGELGPGSSEQLPDWVEDSHEPDARLRDSEEAGAYGETAQVLRSASERLDAGVGAGKLAQKPVGDKSLDDWLAEEGESSESEEDDESEETETEDEDDDSGESEEDSGDEDSDVDREKGRLMK